MTLVHHVTVSKPTPDTLRRLALIRIFLNAAQETALQPRPFNVDSLNRLHDTAEMFLALAVEVHHGKIPREFLGYWDELEKVLGRRPAFQAAMQRMSKARVNLKHYGIEPAGEEIVRSVDAVRGFVTLEAVNLFGVELEQVSLAQLMLSDEGRECVESAESNWASSQHAEAFADLREAFDITLGDYEKDKPGRYPFDSVFDIVKRIPSLPLSERRQQSHTQSRRDEAIEAAIEALDWNLKLVGLGIDLRKYGRFNALTPTVSYMMNGGRSFSVREGWARGQDDFEFCRDFVVTTALHLDEYSFSTVERWKAENVGGSFHVFRRRGPRQSDQAGPSEVSRSAD